jgi:hypothetical protein
MAVNLESGMLDQRTMLLTGAQETLDPIDYGLESLAPDSDINFIELNKYDLSTNAFAFFKERDIIFRDIKNLITHGRSALLYPTSAQNPQGPFKNFGWSEIQVVEYRCVKILKDYTEQPAILDGISKFIIHEAMGLIKLTTRKFMRDTLALNPAGQEDHQKFPMFPVLTESLLKIIYVLVNIRGVENVKKHFPHEAQDLEPLIYCLTFLSTKTEYSWEMKYVLMLWLSLILMMPFTLSVLDSKVCDKFFVLVAEWDLELLMLKTENLDIEDVILNVCKLWLTSGTKMPVAGSICLARFFTREDVKNKGYLGQYMTWVGSALEMGKKQNKTFFITNIWQSLVSIFKILHRTDLLPIFEQTYKIVFEDSSMDEGPAPAGEYRPPACLEGTGAATGDSHSSQLRQFKTKLVQRLGLTILRPTECSWLYKRSKKSLQDN